MIKRLIWLYFLLVGWVGWCAPAPKATQGILDLRNWNWEQQGVVSLDGEWEWYWQQLYPSSVFATSDCPKPTAYIPVPAVWNEYVQAPWWQQGQGYATYRLRVLLPKSKQPIAIKMLTASTAVELYANGLQIGVQGKVGRTKETMNPAYQPFQCRVGTTGDTLELVAHSSNFHYRCGGLWTSIKLGPEAHLSRFTLHKLILDFALSGAFLLMGLYHIGIYVFLRWSRLPLFFGLFCILILIRILVTGECASTVWINWDWEWLVRVEFLSLFLAIVVFVLFSQVLFPHEFPVRVVQWIVGIGIGFVLAPILLSPLLFSFLTRPFQVYLLGMCVYCLWGYIRARKHRRDGSLYFLIGSIVFFICIINDFLFSVYVIQTGYFFYVGLFVFILSQAVTISHQFSMAFTALQQANDDMEEAHEELQQKSSIIYEKNEQLQKVNDELDSVVYRISHDLRSPVASVLGLTGLILAEKDATQIQMYAGLQEKTLHRMDQLIQDIIDYSKNNRAEIHPEPIFFQTLIEHVLEDHSHLEHAEHIQKIIKIDPYQSFIGDARRLAIIFSNLIANAIRYHNLKQDNPFIEIQVRVVHGKACIEVSDNGQGIGKEHLDKIFGMFYRASEQTKGSGLGLYIVKEAITKLQGEIMVYSEPGKGTVFQVTIPDNHV